MAQDTITYIALTTQVYCDVLKSGGIVGYSRRHLNMHCVIADPASYDLHK
jgi:hypothetical protein